tara:strand:+ start:1223 stop:1573 length:351 start_codon:yes stop_codon:yes gene_type:complete
MAYLNKNDIVVIKQKEEAIQARVVDIRWRRFPKSAKDRARNPNGKAWKSVPYAVCQTFMGGLAPVGTEFIIAGYKLQNIDKSGDKLLVLRDKYVAEFDGDWVETLLAESRDKRKGE